MFDQLTIDKDDGQKYTQSVTVIVQLRKNDLEIILGSSLNIFSLFEQILWSSFGKTFLVSKVSWSG